MGPDAVVVVVVADEDEDEFGKEGIGRGSGGR